MSKDDKIKELELEIARLNGVIEGMKLPIYTHPVPVPFPGAPYTYPPYYWHYTPQCYAVPTVAHMHTISTGTN